MQDIYDLTKEEIYALADESIQRYIDIECAKEGVLLLPELPVEPKKDLPKPDSTVYEVGNFHVQSFDEASRILQVLTEVNLVDTTYDYNVGYDFHYTRNPISQPEIKKKSVYSTELYNQLKNTMRKFSQDKKNYDELYKAYQKADSGREEVSKNVWEYVNDIRDEFWQKERLTKEFKRYLALADGDKTIAMNFFQNAYGGELGNMEKVEDFKATLIA